MNVAAPGSEPIRFRLLRGGYFALLGSIVGVLGNFSVSVILARMLRPDEFGIYAIYVVLGIVLIPLLSLSVPSAVTRFTSELRVKDPKRLGVVLPTALLTLLAGGLFGTAFVALAVAPLALRVYGSQVLGPMLVVMGAFLLANFLALFAGAVLQGLEEFAWGSILGGLSVLAHVILLLFIVPGFGLVGAAVAGAVSVLLHALTAILVTSRALHRSALEWRWSFSWPEARAILAFVGPLNAAGMIARGSALVQNSLVALYVGFVDLANFRIAGIFYGALLLIPRTILAPMLPVLTSMTTTRTSERSREVLTSLVKLALVLTVPLAGGLLLATPLAIDVLFGPQYQSAAPLASVLILAAVTVFPTAILGEQYLVARGRTLTALLVTIYSVAVGLLLAFLFLPAYRTMALPLAAIFTESTLLGILVMYVVRRGELSSRPLFRSWAFLFVGTAASFVLAFFLPPGLPAVAAIPVFVALSGIAYFGVLQETERRLIRDTLTRMRRRRNR